MGRKFAEKWTIQSTRKTDDTLSAGQIVWPNVAYSHQNTVFYCLCEFQSNCFESFPSHIRAANTWRKNNSGYFNVRLCCGLTNKMIGRYFSKFCYFCSKSHANCVRSMICAFDRYGLDTTMTIFQMVYKMKKREKMRFADLYLRRYKIWNRSVFPSSFEVWQKITLIG